MRHKAVIAPRVVSFSRRGCVTNIEEIAGCCVFIVEKLSHRGRNNDEEPSFLNLSNMSVIASTSIP